MRGRRKAVADRVVRMAGQRLHTRHLDTHRRPMAMVPNPHGWPWRPTLVDDYPPWRMVKCGHVAQPKQGDVDWRMAS